MGLMVDLEVLCMMGTCRSMYGDDGRSGSIVYDGYIDQCMELIVDLEVLCMMVT